MVTVSEHPLTLPTHESAAPESLPMFLDRRVYQGSRGSVYPMAFIGRIEEKPTPRTWKAVTLENERLKVLLLPEIGGRVHAITDKQTGEELIYRQDVIKPALVGLAGPWISGGIEFNWPQHHRPGTTQPTAVSIEKEKDGSVTVWMSARDPLSGLQGTHGIRLSPNSCLVEVRARLHNPTAVSQTFLWWMNMGIEVDEAAQSFWPEDVTLIADHAKRATAKFPLCDGLYYGVDYGKRAKKGLAPHEVPTRFVPPHAQPKEKRPKDIPEYAPNDLRWYANIPVPTSYMAVGSRKDFFGYYNHRKKVGLVHVADRHVAPGKKQWTWGNHGFGEAWDRLLSPDRRPYIELMAGVFTDNQPDFSFLAAGETREFSQFLFPLSGLGPVQAANTDVALAIQESNGRLRIQGMVTRAQKSLSVAVRMGEKTFVKKIPHLTMGGEFSCEFSLSNPSGLERIIEVRGDGKVLLSESRGAPLAKPELIQATEPPAPSEIPSSDELYLTGLHLKQYRHATRRPDPYFLEALRRDPGDHRAHIALAEQYRERGLSALAESHLEKAVSRVVFRNPNPEDGRAHYLLGLARMDQGKWVDAESPLRKALWNEGTARSARVALAILQSRLNRFDEALATCDEIQSKEPNNESALKIRLLLEIQLGRKAESVTTAKLLLDRNPCDTLARMTLGQVGPLDGQEILDLAHLSTRMGHFGLAKEFLSRPELSNGELSFLSGYALAWCHLQEGNRKLADKVFATLRRQKGDGAFAGRLEEEPMLRAVTAASPKDSRAPWLLGNLLYHWGRVDEAIAFWKTSIGREAGRSGAHRNLAIALANHRQDPSGATSAYAKALAASPHDERLAFEADQLERWKGTAISARLAKLKAKSSLVSRRDDFTVAHARLLLLADRPEEALSAITSRNFQPWEGGEGQVLEVHHHTRMALAWKALAGGDARGARAHLEADLKPPESLGEVRHLLANASDLWWLLGLVEQALGNMGEARRWWQKAGDFSGDFQVMAPTPVSEMTAYRIRCLDLLGRKAEAKTQRALLASFIKDLRSKPAKIDYFATSLPTLLLFHEDMDRSQKLRADFLECQGLLLSGQARPAEKALAVLRGKNPDHLLVAQTLREVDGLPEKGSK